MLTYIFHLYNNGYRVSKVAINDCCEEIIKEASKPSQKRLREGLQSFFSKEISDSYVPTSEKVEQALQMLFGDEFIEKVDLFGMGMKMVET